MTKAVSSAADSYDITRESVRGRCSASSRARMMPISRLRDMAAACGALSPMAAAAVRMSGSGDPAVTTTGKIPRRMPLRIPSGTSTRRCPNRSTASPMTGPAMTTPMPTAAEVSPPSPTEPVAETTRVRTPTTIIAKGSRAMKAIGKSAQPV